MRIIVAGGGTGGHITPIMSVIEELKKLRPEAKIFYIGQKNDIVFLQKFLNQNNIPFLGIYAGKLHRYLTFKNFSIFLSILGFFQSLILIIKIKPNVIFLKGGFVTVPIGLAGALCARPLVLHESDMVMGLSNKILFPFSKAVCMGFKLSLNNPKIHFTGTPIRKDFFITYVVSTHQKPRLLITGGSQGARQINEFIFNNIAILSQLADIIHITGKYDFRKSQNIHKLGYESYEFIETIIDVMRQADIVISRAGANTLNELSALAKAVIIVPLSSAAHDHQNKNALYFKEKNAALIAYTEDEIMKELKQLISDKGLREQLEKNIVTISNPDAGLRIAQTIINEAIKPVSPVRSEFI